MKIAVIDDYQGAFTKTKAYSKLKDHDVVVYNDTVKDPEKLAARLKDADAVVLTLGRAFGMKVTCWGRDASTAKAREAGYDVPATRQAFFEGADIISLHLPLNKDTRGIVTAADLDRMKPTAMIANTSRGPIIAEGALEQALKKGRPGMAAIDVYDSEPVNDANYPLLKMKNVICTPHLGYVEERVYEGIYGVAIDQIVAFAQGKPINVVNAEALTKS